ncbi:toprim domain-containing protein [Actinomadura verrucosospora]|uniref:DNA primase catalytic core domain-containing protein n=1 Tax=Actinomadura verrucosospora TaxID=46165 RepID=A0A7D3ZFP6_ACTVE|nr:toprim domain-containing protein [Actinomadura verrucosospora]QKG22237.1 DNA primase catalytic core domain-containing protein [Actinomadura verrucosospora]
MTPTPREDDRRRLAALLRDMAAHETSLLRDGTRPWTWWLDRAVLHGRRHGYVNTLLIGAQWRAAADVRSYEDWRAAGRQVRRGETGIRVLSRTGRPYAVFDIAQTAGLPLPPVPAGPPAPPDGVVRRLVDEQGLAPVEADSVAYLVLAWLGLEPEPPVFPVNAFWAGADAGDRILRTARRVHDRVRDPSGGVLPDAHRFFRARVKASWVPAYLDGRGFPAAVQRRREIGCAPDSPHALVDHLRSLGHPDEAIVASGLARQGASGRPHVMFRDRAMFPIRRPDGVLAGFIGRRRDGGEGPKYLNGPDTELFHKGELLYGLHEVRERLAAGARPVLVEGPLDAIAVEVAGPSEFAAVATCGLSLTAAHLAVLADAADLAAAGVLTALDDDPAGRSAAVRAWDVLNRVTGPLDLAALPGGEDPAGVLAAHGRDALLGALRAAAPLMDAVVDAAAARAGGPLATPEQRLAALRAACGPLAARPSGAARQVVRLAARTALPPSLVTETVTERIAPAP